MRAGAGLAGLVLLGTLGGCLAPAAPGSVAGSGSPWPEADALFRSNPRWLGGDGGMTVDLGDGRLLWLFGDTLVARNASAGDRSAAFLANTMGLSSATDPLASGLSFHWRETRTPGPLPPARDAPWPLPLDSPLPGDAVDIKPILPDDGPIVHWPAGGAMVDGTLVLLASRIDYGSGAFGFRGMGTDVYFVDDVRGAPEEWQWEGTRLPTRFGGELTVGSGSVLVEGPFLLAFGQRDWKDASGWTHHDPVLLRWPRSAVAAHRLGEAEWFDPSRGAWRPEGALAGYPPPLWGEGAPAYSVHWDAALGRYVEIQSTGFGATPVQARVAQRPEGPWSNATTVYLPPETADKALLEYMATAHPTVAGGGLAITYSVNLADGSLGDPRYRPRFARLALSLGP